MSKQIIALVVTLLVGAVIGVLLLGALSNESSSRPQSQSQPESTPPSTSPPEGEQDAEEPEPTLPPMKTSASPYFGVAFSYPESWEAEQSSYQGVPTRITISHPALIVWVEITTRDRDFQRRHNLLTPEDEVNRWLGVVGSRDRQLLSKPTTTTIQGYAACTVTYITPSTGAWHRFTAVKKGDLIYCVRGVNNDPLYQAEAEAILDSFRFIDE